MDADALVVGAGAVGLAVGRALALAGLETVIADGEPHYGSGVSARNSEVVHAGLYYPPDSLKARLCVAGRDALWRYVEARHVPARQTGKLIVAVDEAQRPALDALAANAAASGAGALTLLDRAGVAALEPALSAAAALHSPLTGIVDSHALMTAYLGDAEDAGTIWAPHAAVEGAVPVPGGWSARLAAGGSITARWLVNAAGLGAHGLAGRIDGLAAAHVPARHFAKGSYFGYAGRTPFARLIYPLPEPGGLGVHLTLDLAGRARFGPDVEWVNEPEYDVDSARAPAFANAVSRWWPGVEAERLVPDYAGVRPKLSGPGEPVADFNLSGPADHGLPGLVNLFGIESPGLTASLALGDHVLGLMREADG